MPRHAQSNRRRWAWSIGRSLLFFATAGGFAAWEAFRIADARAPVASGWAAGIAAGTGSGLVLAAPVAVTALIRGPRAWSRLGRPQALLIFILMLTNVLLLFVALLISTPPRQYGTHPVPVIASGVEVAEIAYLGTISAGFAVTVVAWLAAQVRRCRPSPALEQRH